MGNGGSTGWLNGNIADNGLLVFNRSDSPTFSGVISGSGNVQQAGSGTLFIGGTNSFTGSMILSAGTLALDSAAALQGGTVVLSGGLLNFNNFNPTLGGLSGSGSLALGNGSVSVGGNGASYSGTLTGGGGLIKVGAGAGLDRQQHVLGRNDAQPGDPRDRQ